MDFKGIKRVIGAFLAVTSQEILGPDFKVTVDLAPKEDAPDDVSFPELDNIKEGIAIIYFKEGNPPQLLGCEEVVYGPDHVGAMSTTVYEANQRLISRWMSEQDSGEYESLPDSKQPECSEIVNFG